MGPEGRGGCHGHKSGQLDERSGFGVLKSRTHLQERPDMVMLDGVHLTCLLGSKLAGLISRALN